MSEQEQLEVFTVQPKVPISDGGLSLLWLVRQLEDGSLQIPIFQREYCWVKSQLVGWVNSVIAHDAIGVIVTYQINGKGPLFLADGLQRLTATSRFLRHPEAYGFSFGRKQAESYVMAFQLPRQHRHYKDHRAAMAAFQNLNKGTALTPAEFYKGILTVDHTEGSYVVDRLPSLIQSSITSLVGTRKEDRRSASISIRDNYALLLQYMSGTSLKTFWGAGSTKIKDLDKCVEAELGKHIAGYTMEDIETEMNRFDRFVHMQMVEIEQAVERTGQTGKRGSRTFVRWLLHLCIWRKNIGIPVVQFKAFLDAFLTLYQETRTFSSRIEAIDPSDGKRINIGLYRGDINSVSKLCRVLGKPLENGRQSTPGAAPGYDVSHINPVSSAGEGPTVFEPSTSNRARGAKPIEGNK